MKTTRIAGLLSNNLPVIGVKVAGWVRTKRDAKGFAFIEINDGSCMENLQVIAEAALPSYTETVENLTTGSAVSFEGDLVGSPGNKQKVELRASSVTVFGIAPDDYPLQKKHHGFEFLRQIAHLRPRTNAIGAVARMRSSLSFAVHCFFQERGFVYVHTPIITTSDCEGAGEMFKVTTLDFNNIPKTSGNTADYSKDFFGKQAGLTVSGQLEGEIYAMSMGRIYTFGPTFRAENSNTARHLAEFWMIEPEAAFFDLADDMDLAEEFVVYLVRHALEKNSADVSFFNQRVDTTLLATLENIASNKFERISYTDAVKYLEKAGDIFENKAGWGFDIQSEHERYLTEKIFKKPVVVFDYPAEIKSFYMKQNDDGKTVKAMDVLVPRIGELVGGSEREDRLDVLRRRMTQQGLDERNYWWYCDLRKYGSAPHAGFGLGFERLMLLVTGMQNIRDVIPFPRYPGNAEF
ncbi:MAG TPA: asparagine--tRNA ligase [Fibrobacteres bacterium]|nr:asparagine--tRNA ligase [Fibrobacterota bacterium]